MLKTATRVPLLVGHTTGLHLPAPSYILFERVREPRNVMSPLSFPIKIGRDVIAYQNATQQTQVGNDPALLSAAYPVIPTLQTKSNVRK